jgi:hypothetical protein
VPARPREEPEVVLPCGHWVSMLGALRVLGAVLGQLEQWCEKCQEWVVIPPPKKTRPRKSKVPPQEEMLF